ncbi:MAG: hypothetical protein BIFFINMI_03661 [Phycisphaerae bacterium]|nr:hypothetical protein [Phycisphaerae bacterium]
MRVLFIGNSHTYANGLPFQVRAMIDHARGPGACQAWLSAPGGQPLTWHGVEPTTTMTVRYQPWDAIVLQQVTHPFAGYARLLGDYERLAPHLELSGARIVLFMTWCKKGEADRQPAIDAAFTRLADEQGLTLAPVSRAWHAALAGRPDIDLYQPDGGHASAAGSYLAACVFFGVLTGLPPADLPAKIAVAGDTLADLPPADAADLQRFAREALSVGK